MRRKSITAVSTIATSVIADQHQAASICWQIQAAAPTAAIAAKKKSCAAFSTHEPAATRVPQAEAKAVT
jgi:hypothetical protein